MAKSCNNDLNQLVRLQNDLLADSVKTEIGELAFKSHASIVSTAINYILGDALDSKKFGKYFDSFRHSLELKKNFLNQLDVAFNSIGKEELPTVLDELHRDYLETDYDFIGERLEIKKSKRKMRDRGAVYTPQMIAKDMVSKTIRNSLRSGVSSKELKILDFGCGTGIFYLKAFDYLTQELKLDDYEVVSEILYAIDLDGIAVDVLKLQVLNRLGTTKKSQLKAISNNILVKNMLITRSKEEDTEFIDYDKDFSDVLSGGGFNVILSNPPYFLLKVNKKNETEEYVKLLARVRNEIDFFRNSGVYRLSIEGMLNYYRLSLEMILNISSNNAELGIICPSTLFTDISSSKLRKHLLLNHKLRGIKYFPESSRIFNGVSQSTVIFYLQKGKNTEDILIDVNGRTFLVDISRITDLFGKNYEIPYIDEKGWKIMQKMSKFRKLSGLIELRNRRGELDLTQYRNFITQEDTGFPLIRGNMISEGKIVEGNEYVLVPDFLAKKSPDYLKNDFRKIRLVCQQVSNIDLEKRLNFALSKKNHILANSCNYISCEDLQFLKQLKQILNSRLLNWRFKVTSGNNHIGNYELGELPIPKITQNALKEGDGLLNEVKIAKLYGLNKGELEYILGDRFDEKDIMEAWIKA